MAIPDYQTVMLPLLELIADGKEHSLRQTIESLADVYSLLPEERKRLLPSGQQAIFDNRVAWARTYLKQAELLEATRRAHFRITDRGRKVLEKSPPKINVKFLEQFKEFREFRKRSRKADTRERGHKVQDKTPREVIEEASLGIREELIQDLLSSVMDSPPSFFERLVVELLLEMGYGGSLKDAGEAVGQSGDEGIDGIIKEDRLGLEVVYLQAKRWKNPVGRPEIQKFVGALHGRRARKGVFITTSGFTNGAKDYVAKVDSKVVLIDGVALANLMIDHDIGVSTVGTYQVKRIDSDYFSED